MSNNKIVISLLLLIGMSSPLTAQESRWIDPALDLQNLQLARSGDINGGDGQIIRFRNWAALSPTRKIEAGDYTLPLSNQYESFEGFSYEIDGTRFSLEDFMEHNHVGGVLVIKDGTIRLERYGLGNTEDTLWVSFSVSKSVTSLLLGAAIQDGYIGSVDEKITDYLPRLKGSAYDQARIRDVLQMASGVAWDETYGDPNSDVGSYPSQDVIRLFEYLGAKEQVAEPGEVFNYNTGETDLVGALVRAAIGNNLTTYLTHKIWQPFGMEADANWATHGPGGGERGGCCMNVTLRDYGRIGLFAMGGGILPDGARVLPENWMQQSTAPSKGSAGYGYLWWLTGDGAYRAIGIYGQGIYINPDKNLVIAVISAWPRATGNEYSMHRNALFEAIAERY